LRLPSETKASSDPLSGYLSELDMCIEPAESGLRDGKTTCLRANLFVTSTVIDMLNKLSHNPNKGFVVLTSAEVYTLLRKPEDVDFPTVYRQAHTYVLPIHKQAKSEHFLTALLRRVNDSVLHWNVEAAVFDSSPMDGWYKEEVRAQVSQLVGRFAGKMGMDQGGVKKLTATVNRWECFLPTQENPSCALFHATLTLAVSLGLNSSVVTPELVDFLRKILHQACLSALDETCPNKRAIQEVYQVLAAKLLHQTPTHVLSHSCRLMCCCVNALVHVHPARPIYSHQYTRTAPTTTHCSSSAVSLGL
jgi:hypothetical protein